MRSVLAAVIAVMCVACGSEPTAAVCEGLAEGELRVEHVGYRGTATASQLRCESGMANGPSAAGRSGHLCTWQELPRSYAVVVLDDGDIAVSASANSDTIQYSDPVGTFAITRESDGTYRLNGSACATDYDGCACARNVVVGQ